MKYARMKKERQKRALERRENNVTDYQAGRLGTLILPEGVDKDQFLKEKLTKAESEVEALKVRTR